MVEIRGEPDPRFERFLTALNREEPDRVPLGEFLMDREVKEAFLGKHVGDALRYEDYDLEADVEFWYRARYDYIHLVPNYLGLFETKWRMGESEIKYESGKYERAWAEEGTAVIASLEDVERYRWPTLEEVGFEHVERLPELLPDGMGMTSGTWGIMEMTRFLMGFENFCLATIEQPEVVDAVFEKVGNLLLQIFSRVAHMDAVGALWYADDVASAEALFVRPEFLREHLFPWMSKIAAVANEVKKPLIYHCDGVMWEILDDVVEMGFAAIQPVEPKAMDIVEVKKRYGDRLALLGNIDIGGSLGRGTPEEVRREVRMRIRQLAPGGGYIVSSSNSIANYIPLENYKAMIQATLDYGKYPIRA